ncbi:hypothetical protein CEXT_138611 [Caerostris extrusa]|uniref:Uncharacterized protein n=1 Tax=Caerostris extrusa TaxID=172846 RepID=A0AAV4VQK2_CAEEX|nr:hypothetical protein CEXT_138611 [Caerostris extrusa]
MWQNTLLSFTGIIARHGPWQNDQTYLPFSAHHQKYIQSTCPICPMYPLSSAYNSSRRNSNNNNKNKAHAHDDKTIDCCYKRVEVKCSHNPRGGSRPITLINLRNEARRTCQSKHDPPSGSTDQPSLRRFFS